LGVNLALPVGLSIASWWLTYPSEKYESQLGLLFSIDGNKNMFQTTNQVKTVHLQLHYVKQLIESNQCARPGANQCIASFR